MSAIDRPAFADGPSEARKGVAYCVAAHVVWGVMAYYFKLIEDASPVEIAVHRGLWSIVVGLAVIWHLGQFDNVRRAMANPRILLTLCFTGLLILFGWSFYIWAIQHGRTIEATLGFYVNPLMNVVAGALFLGERFSRLQLVAIILAVVAVLIQTIASGIVPWLGLMLSASFCLYGLIRKTTPVGATEGFFIEVLVIFVPSLAMAFWLDSTGEAKFLTTPFYTLMLMGCGVLTAVALLFFAAAIKRIRYSTAGLLQYISPSLVFLTAVFIFGEPMDGWRWFAFALLWVALAIYSYSALEQMREPAPA
ncbi:EamA family transporter RarD [Taklimakanibacter deserti]|jgi:chloramphenicol-sensitive protein RarD|uniref:EamA family transporter RarD n=1 Tax=Taklimakanibacter deserti TaxID=2267839 RepID=UPI000E648D32